MDWPQQTKVDFSRIKLLKGESERIDTKIIYDIRYSRTYLNNYDYSFKK